MNEMEEWSVLFQVAAAVTAEEEKTREVVDLAAIEIVAAEVCRVRGLKPDSDQLEALCVGARAIAGQSFMVDVVKRWRRVRTSYGL